MGRRRGYDEDEVLDRASGAFLRAGYEGTSVEELVSATGLLRGSLYQAFGSKRGLFLRSLGRRLDSRPADEATTDLVLVALLELAPRDTEVRALLARHLEQEGTTATDLGARLLARARIDASGE